MNKILKDKGSKFSSRLEPGIKNLGKITGSAMKKKTSLRPCNKKAGFWNQYICGYVHIGFWKEFLDATENNIQ